MYASSWASQMVLVVKNPPANTEDLRDSGFIPGSGRSPGGGHGNPLQYPCLDNPPDRGAWWAMGHRVAKSQKRLKRQHACTHVQMIRIICHLCNLVYKSVNCSWLL